MATRKSAKRRPTRTAKKRSTAGRAAKKSVRARSAERTTARRSTAPRRTGSAPAPPAAARRNAITHTELASLDPPATRRWCEDVLGWTFGDPVETGAGPYHMWRFAIGTGGGIRANNPPEMPGSIPYCEVEEIQATYRAALAAGAVEMLSPIPLPGGMGWVAIVAAPGGVPIGFWAAR